MSLATPDFDMDVDGRDAFSVQYQNANNSVRVTDEFMQAVVSDADWELRAITTGEPMRTIKARHLWRQIAEAAWESLTPHPVRHDDQSLAHRRQHRADQAQVTPASPATRWCTPTRD